MTTYFWATPDDTDTSCRDQLATVDTGLGVTGFTLVETDIASGIFVGDFAVPTAWCRDPVSDTPTQDTETTTGLDLEVNYVDFRDASGEIIEVGDSAGIRANTGSISLDRTVYPVPFGVPDDFDDNTNNSPSGRSVFPIHLSGLDTVPGLGVHNIANSNEFLETGDLQIHIRVNDPDFDLSPEGEDKICLLYTSPSPRAS